MDVAQIVKSTQEQGVAAWVDYLNQLRLNELLAKLTSQNMNLGAGRTSEDEGQYCCLD